MTPNIETAIEEDDEISLLDLLQVVADNLRLLVLGPLAAGLLALGISFAIAPTFTATTKFMPPQQQQSAAASMLSSLGVKILTGEWLEPQLIYGYFPCTAEGNSVHVYDPSVIEQGLTPQTATPVVTWTFPRQKSLRRLCLADFFRPLSENKFDVFPMQAVTMGEVASEKAQVLFKADNYANYLYFHGMAVQMAEGLAEWGHARIRKELGYGDLEPDNIRDMLAQRYQGSRYSFGYPACPNVADQLQQLKIMGTERMGMTMDESEQLYPEQSTTALIVYHPVAKYFSA